MKRTLLIILVIASLALTGCSTAPAAQSVPAAETAAVTPNPVSAPTPEPTPAPTPSPEEIYSDSELTREYFSSGVHDISAVDEALLLEYPALREYYIESVPFDLSEAGMYETPDSSCFSAVGYSAVREILAVRFRSSGAVYIYSGVGPEVWADFSAAPSLGKYYNAYIKPVYASERWDG